MTTDLSQRRIFKTTDGGYTWIVQWIDSLPDSQVGYFGRLYFIDQNHGWVVGTALVPGPKCCVPIGQIIYTSNGGDTWDVSTFGWWYIWDIHAIDSNNVWTVGDRVIYSNDNFQTVKSQNVSGYDIEMVSLSIGYIATYAGEIYKTTNGGDYWNLNFTEPEGKSFRAMHFIDENYGWAGGVDMTLYHTQNGGQSWVKQNVPSSQVQQPIQDIHFVDSNNGWLITPGEGGEIWRTRDGGQIWLLEFISSSPPSPIGIHFTDINNGWVADYLGKIYKYQSY